MSKTKIAVIGSCVSRDGFNSNFVKDYKKYYKCVLAQNHMSMISLMAQPIPHKPPGQLEGEITDFNKQILMTELTKSVWDSLEIHMPEYVILDFYADVYFGIREVGNSYITNKTWLFKKTPFYSTLDLRNTMNLNSNYERYMQLWKNSIDEFMETMTTRFPHIKIIVNKVHFTDYYVSKEDNELKKISETGVYKKIDVDEVNGWLDDFYAYFEENYNVDYLNYDKEYYSDENHIWNFFYVHYTQEFYDDFTKKLLQVIDLDKSRKLARIQGSGKTKMNRNLIRNSTFNEGNSFWTYWHNDFEISRSDSSNMASNVLSIKIDGLGEDRLRQVWSNAVEINTDGNQEYTISFDVKIDNIESLDVSGLIFSLSSFNKIDHHRQEDSVWNRSIKISDVRKIKHNTWARVSVTFKPTKGKFLKVGPCIKRNGHVSWRNIKLEKGKKSTAWVPSYREGEADISLTNQNLFNKLVKGIAERISSFAR